MEGQVVTYQAEKTGKLEDRRAELRAARHES